MNCSSWAVYRFPHKAGARAVGMSDKVGNQSTGGEDGRGVTGDLEGSTKRTGGRRRQCDSVRACSKRPGLQFRSVR